METMVTSQNDLPAGSHAQRGPVVQVVDTTEGTPMTEAITIRHSTHSDRWQIVRLAALDDRPAPCGEALLAFVGAELRAALALEGRGIVADPFHRTQQLVDLLRLRAAQELDGRNGRRRGPAARRRIPIRTVEAAA